MSAAKGQVFVAILDPATRQVIASPQVGSLRVVLTGTTTPATTYTDHSGSNASSSGLTQTDPFGNVVTFIDTDHGAGIDIIRIVDNVTLVRDFEPAFTPAGNVELGYAEKNDANATSTTNYPSVDPVAGLLISFTAPDRPYYVELTASVVNNTTGDYAVLALQESLDGGSTWAVINYGAQKAASTSDNALSLTVRRRRNPAEGTAVQYRAALARITGGTATLAIDATSTFPALAMLSAVRV